MVKHFWEYPAISTTPPKVPHTKFGRTFSTK